MGSPLHGLCPDTLADVLARLTPTEAALLARCSRGTRSLCASAAPESPRPAPHHHVLRAAEFLPRPELLQWALESRMPTGEALGEAVARHRLSSIIGAGPAPGLPPDAFDALRALAAAHPGAFGDGAVRILARGGAVGDLATLVRSGALSAERVGAAAPWACGGGADGARTILWIALQGMPHDPAAVRAAALREGNHGALEALRHARPRKGRAFLSCMNNNK
jgi:hypothetical protein